MNCTYCSDRAEEFVWTETEGGVKVIGYNGSQNYVRIPSQIAGKPVVSIGAAPRDGSGSPTQELHVLIPSTVASIDPGALYLRSRFYDNFGSWFSAFDLEDGHPWFKEEGKMLLSADGKTLYHCYDTSSSVITVPEGVTVLGKDALASCQMMHEVKLPASLEFIDDRAFAKRSFYQEVVLPEGVKKIGSCLFDPEPNSWSHDINSLRVPSGLQELAGGMRINWKGLETNPNFLVQENMVLSPDGKKLHLFIGDPEIADIVVPEGIEEIMPHAFDNAEAIKKLVLHTTLKIIRKDAFPAHKVKTLRVPASLEDIEDGGFPYGGLGSVLVDKKNTHLYTDKTSLYRVLEGGKLELLCCFRGKIEEYAVVDGTVRILPEAFRNCSVLKKLTLPESLEEFDENCLNDATRDLVIPRNVRSISFHTSSRFNRNYTIEDNPHLFWENHILYQNTEEGLVAIRGLDAKLEHAVLKEGTVRVAANAFCGGVKTLVCPASLRRIEEKAFASTFLTEIQFNEGLEFIGSLAFDGSAITHVSIPASVSYLAQNAFQGCPVEAFRVAEGSAHYCAADGALYNADKTVLYRVPVKTKCAEFVVPESVADIGRAFRDCENIKSIRLPAGLKHLWKNAMDGCKKLKHLYANPALEYIHDDFISYGFPTTIHTDPDTAMLRFQNRTIAKNNMNLKLKFSINGMESLSTLSADFSLMPNPTGLTISKHLTKNKDVVVPEKLGEYTVTRIGPNAFLEAEYGKECLSSVVLPDSVTELAENAFAGCKKLRSLTLGSGLRRIGAGAFRHCEMLTRLEIPEGVEELEDYTFFGCKSLDMVIIPASVTKISSKIFADHSGYKDLYLNKNCIYQVVPGSFAESFLKNYPVSTYGKQVNLNVISLSADDPVIGKDDDKYLEYLDYTPQEDGTTLVCLKREIPNGITEAVIPASIRGMTVSAFSSGRYNIPQCFTRLSIPATVTKLELSSLSNPTDSPDYLTCIEVAGENPSFATDGQAIYSKDYSRLLRMLNPQVESYTVHPDTRIICTGAFHSLPRLTRLVLPQGLEKIEGNSLAKTLEVIEGLEHVGSISSNAVQNTVWYNNQSVVYLGTTLDRYKETNAVTCSVREGTTTISANAFRRDFIWGQSNTDALEEVILPDSVVTMEPRAFSTRVGIKSIRLSNALTVLDESVLADCRGIETLRIPASVEQIHPTALPNHNNNWNSIAYCALRQILVDENNPCFKSVDGILYSKDGGTLVRVPPRYPVTEFTVPEGVHTIAPRAFHFLDQLQSVILPETVHIIGEESFASCLELTQIVMPGVKTIANDAFRKCGKLKKMFLPDGLEFIGEKAFAECGFSAVEIPKSVKTVKPCAFAHCDTITVYDSIDPDVKPAGQISWGDPKASPGYIADRDKFLGNTWHNHTITVRSAQTGEIKFVLPLFSDEKNYDYYSLLMGSWGKNATFDFARLDEYFPEIKGMPNKLTAAVHRLKYPVDLTDNVKDTYTAYLSKSAKDLVKSCIDSGDMETLVFCVPFGILKKSNIDDLIEYATKAKAAEFAAYLMRYKDENFVSKKGGARIPGLSLKAASPWTNPKTGTSKIGRYKGIDAVVEYPTELGGKPITGIASTTSKSPDNYKSIVEVVIPEGYEDIGDYAFCGCEKLERVSLPSTLQTIGRDAFCNCRNLKEIIIPDSVTFIDQGAFYGCQSLAKVVMSGSVNAILTGVFYGCDSLTEIELPASIHTLYKDSFCDCPNLAKIVYHGTELLGDGAPFWNTPEIHVNPGTTVKVYGVRKKDIHYTGGQAKAPSPTDVQYSEVDSIEFKGQIFVLSGFGAAEESELSRIISEEGGEVKSSLVLKTNYLIMNENYGGVTSKYNKAVELNAKGKNIIILSGSRFRELVK